MDFDNAAIQKIISAVLEGDVNRFEEIIDLYKKRIWSIVGRFAQNEQERMEWTHEVFLRIFKNLYQYRREAPFEHWASRIALNTTYALLKQKKNHIMIMMDSLSPEEQIWIERQITDQQKKDMQQKENQERAQSIAEKAMTLLKPEQQWMIHMTELENKSLKEIAELMSWSYVSAKVKAYRARKALEKILIKLMNKGIDHV